MSGQFSLPFQLLLCLLVLLIFLWELLPCFVSTHWTLQGSTGPRGRQGSSLSYPVHRISLHPSQGSEGGMWPKSVLSERIPGALQDPLEKRQGVRKLWSWKSCSNETDGEREDNAAEAGVRDGEKQSPGDTLEPPHQTALWSPLILDSP